MAGRDDKNKKGTPGRSGDNQSKQRSDADRNKSKANTKQTSGDRAEPGSNAPGKKSKGEGRHATNEELARDKEMD